MLLGEGCLLLLWLHSHSLFQADSYNNTFAIMHYLTPRALRRSTLMLLRGLWPVLCTNDGETCPKTRQLNEDGVKFAIIPKLKVLSPCQGEGQGEGESV